MGSNKWCSHFNEILLLLRLIDMGTCQETVLLFCRNWENSYKCKKFKVRILYQLEKSCKKVQFLMCFCEIYFPAFSYLESVQNMKMLLTIYNWLNVFFLTWNKCHFILTSRGHSSKYNRLTSLLPLWDLLSQDRYQTP